MKVQIERKEVRFDAANVKFPIYSYIEEDGGVLYTKLTSGLFHQIRVSHFEVTVTKFKTNNKSISGIWFDNQCDQKRFQEGIRVLKRYVAGLI